MTSWEYPRFLPFRRQLEAAAANWFSHNKYETQSNRKYILADKRKWQQNIILPEVAELVESSGTKLHKDIYNGLSSQAFAFNLLGPFIVKNDLAALRQAILGGSFVDSANDLQLKFEFEDRTVFNEASQQPTSIDARLHGPTTDLYIEVKLQEKEFGGCSLIGRGDCEGMNPAKQFDLCYLHAGAKRKYWNRLKEFEFLNQDFFDGPMCPLGRYYQFYREVTFALAKGGTFVLLVDDRNPAFNRSGGTPRGLFPFLKSSVPQEYQDRVMCVSVQSILQQACDSELHRAWIDDFNNKYGMHVSG